MSNYILAKERLAPSVESPFLVPLASNDMFASKRLGRAKSHNLPIPINANVVDEHALRNSRHRDDGSLRTLTLSSTFYSQQK